MKSWTSQQLLTKERLRQRSQKPCKSFVAASPYRVINAAPGDVLNIRSGPKRTELKRTVRCNERNFRRVALLEQIADAEQRRVNIRIAIRNMYGKAAGIEPPALRARVDLVHALLNHNDFVTIR